MRAAALAAVGCVAGVVFAATVVLLFGMVLGSLGIQFYDAEAGQQRNFNLALVFVAVVAALGTWLGYRVGKR